MSRKIILIQKKRGGCLGALLALFVIGLAVYAAALAACVAAGVGLWLLARYTWRSLVRERPDIPLVQKGLALAPIARKDAAAVPCALISLCLIGALGSTVAGTRRNAVDSSDTPAIEQPQTQSTVEKKSEASPTATSEKAQPSPTAAAALDLASIPAYSGTPSVQVLGNEPQFTDEDKARSSFEEYSDLDSLGRCGVAFALIGTETMPSEERGSIGMVKPSGWHTARYDGLVDGNYLYNRCHLIAYQLAGENANEKNLITGTRYLNTEGMLPFEDQVADYVKGTGSHVLYRVTPIFEGDNLVASGVQIEAWSVEDEGAGVSFNVYCYNVQPGVDINYATGDSALAEEQAAGGAGEEAASQAGETDEASDGEQGEEASSPASSDSTEQSYVLNTSTKKFHRPGCGSASKISAKNRRDFTGTRDEVISQGYDPCKKCNP